MSSAGNVRQGLWDDNSSRDSGSANSPSDLLPLEQIEGVMTKLIGMRLDAEDIWSPDLSLSSYLVEEEDQRGHIERDMYVC